MNTNKKRNTNTAKLFINKHCPYKRLMESINYKIYSNKLCVSEVNTLYDKEKDSLFNIELDEDNIIFTLIPAKIHNIKHSSIPINLDLKKNEFNISLDNLLFIFEYKIKQLNSDNL